MYKVHTPSFRVKAATGLLGFLGNTGHRDKYTNTNTRVVQRNKRQFISELRCHHGKIVEGRQGDYLGHRLAVYFRQVE